MASCGFGRLDFCELDSGRVLMGPNSERWFLGAAVMAAGKGGIARVARLSAKALADSGADLDMLAFLDPAPVDIVGRSAPTARGSRLKFFAGCHAAALGHNRFLYDSVGIARAHPRAPGWRRPYAVWIHGVEVWDGLNAERARALRGADLVLVNSQFTLERFSDLHWPLERAEVCWLATEEDETPRSPHRFDGPPTALLIGRVDRANFRKGHKEVVECWADVVSAVPDAQLLLVGGGDGLSLLRETVQASPACESIHVLGFVAEEELPAIWARAHVFAQPSWKEGFGLVYAEAMRHGLPVIASIHDAGREINVDGETGYNVALDRPGELSERLISLLRNPDAAKAMGQAGQARWTEHFRYGAFRDRFGPLLQDGLHT